jgi:hypothetical protein
LREAVDRGESAGAGNADSKQQTPNDPTHGNLRVFDLLAPVETGRNLKIIRKN